MISGFLPRFLLAVISSLALLSGQDRVSIEPRSHLASVAAPLEAPHVDLRVDVPLVLIPVHVTTPLGASVSTLNREDFHLSEDGVDQQITHFAKEDAHLSLGLVFDTSGSMRNKIRKSFDAAGEFLKTTDPEDEFFLVEFNERPTLSVSFTQDLDRMQRGLAAAKPFGRTSLLDAIHLALMQMKKARNFRKGIVILSDGGDNHSRHSELQIKDAVRESDAQIYAMGIYDPAGPSKRSPEERDGPRLLDELAGESGGMMFAVASVDDLPAVCARIARELRTQYLLGYSPTNSDRDGKYRHIKVGVSAPAGMPTLRPYYRTGYYAPNN
jgi:Ca-activated chloride channel family protein